LIHPVLAGFCAFLATIIGSFCFNLDNPIYVTILGFGIFLMVNNGLYKFKFNSYNLNGVTTTTIVIFVSQTGLILLWKGDQVKMSWMIGVILIMVGVTLL
jgi:hypothetical protein